MQHVLSLVAALYSAIYALQVIRSHSIANNCLHCLVFGPTPYCSTLLSTVVPPHSYQEELPNIPNVAGSPWPGVGHIARQGGGARNAFGKVSASGSAIQGTASRLLCVHVVQLVSAASWPISEAICANGLTAAGLAPQSTKRSPTQYGCRPDQSPDLLSPFCSAVCRNPLQPTSLSLSLCLFCCRHLRLLATSGPLSCARQTAMVMASPTDRS
jgi:hypothetical protein